MKKISWSSKNQVKGSVSQDGRGYKSGINRKVSLNPGASEAKKVILLKGQLPYPVTFKGLSTAVPKHLI